MIVQEGTLSIENNFWSTDKAALNILLNKLDQSNKTTFAIKDFFNQRARIEEEYGNQLLKLSETFQLDEEQDNDKFNIISNTTEMSARAHIELSQNIKNLLELPLNDFIKDQDNIKLYMTNQMKESQNMKLLHDSNVKKTRCSYVNECQKTNSSDKEIEVLDFEYQQAINLMQLNSPAWIHDWRESCKTFESLESNRLDYLKAVIKTFSSMIACTYSIDDQTCDRLLSSMNDINTIEEIKKFISNQGTGSTIPEIPKYTKFKRESKMLEAIETTKVQQPKKTRTIKEIVIPNHHDEQLRSVNDQLKKIPSPWYNKGDDNSLQPKMNSVNQTLFPPQQYPLNPVYKKLPPHQSDPILNNYKFQQDDKKYKSTLVTPHEEKHYNNTMKNTEHQADDLPTKTTTTTNKKPSLFFAPLSFLKKKKVTGEQQEYNSKQKRLSLGCISSSTQHKRNSSSIVLTPSSPMFSQVDFYYSPSSNNDTNNHNHHLIASPPPTIIP